MTVFKRDTLHHTYADYLVWSRTYGDELVDGTAYVREPPSPTRAHQEIVGEVYRQAATALKGSPAAYMSRRLTSVCPSRPKKTIKSTP